MQASKQITYDVLNALNVFTHLVAVSTVEYVYVHIVFTFLFYFIGFILSLCCIRLCVLIFLLSLSPTRLNVQQIIPQALMFALIFFLLF